MSPERNDSIGMSGLEYNGKNSSDKTESQNEAKGQDNPKKRRGRKAKAKTIESEVVKKRKRMEINRMSAKRNREQKKEYIASLETKVRITLKNR